MREKLKKILANISKPTLSKIHKYKDFHKNESCYLIGDGISLKWFDLSLFHDRVSIPTGFLPFHNDFDKLNVKYSLFIEPWYFYPLRESNKIAKLYKKEIIYKYKDINFFINLSNYPFIKKNSNINYVFNNDFFDSRIQENFISNRINAFHGVFRFSISLAVYMGFEHIYLLGCDYTHVPSRSLHWYEKGKGVLLEQPNYQKNFIEIAKEFIDITTITLDGKSDFINYIKYEDFTGKKPVFKENNQLLSENKLIILNSRNRYKIY